MEREGGFCLFISAEALMDSGIARESGMVSTAGAHNQPCKRPLPLAVRAIPGSDNNAQGPAVCPRCPEWLQHEWEELLTWRVAVPAVLTLHPTPGSSSGVSDFSGKKWGGGSVLQLSELWGTRALELVEKGA